MPYTETVTEYVDETVVVTPARTEKKVVAWRRHYTWGKAEGLVSPWVTNNQEANKWETENGEKWELYNTS